MPSLSVLITARNEQWLPNTVSDILANLRGDTNVIVSLDGPGNPTFPDHPRVVKLNHPAVIGQRAGINAAARASSAKYLMKLDAHCSVDEGFDLKLMQPYEKGEIGMDTTTIPRMYNLHCFSWKCRKCGNETYQGPRLSHCDACKQDAEFEQLLVWKPRRHKRTDFARFDETLHFQYHRDYERRPEAQGDICDVMCFVGAGFFMPRDWYWHLEGMDEAAGSWGQMGVEVSCKSWLSGGRQVVNKRTWFTHLFRTQPGFGFPYANPGIGARKYSQDMWLNNKWKKQTHPLSWILEKFAPLPGWNDPIGADILKRVTEAGAIFRTAHPLADSANTLIGSVFGGPITDPGIIQRMALSAIRQSAASHIGTMGNQSDVIGVAAVSPIANKMVQFGLASSANRDRANQPCVSKSMSLDSLVDKKESTITGVIQLSGPEPASSVGINDDLRKESTKSPSVNVGNCEILAVSHSGPPLQARDRLEAGHAPTRSASLIISKTPTKGIIYYSDNRLNPVIAEAVQNQIKRSVNGHQIVSVTLQPMDFGMNRVLDLERSILTMYNQILLGLIDSTADIIFFAEHDVLYSPSHYKFIPPDRHVYYYNTNTWKVDSVTGRALYYYTQQVSGLCAYRDLLLQHYEKRVKRVEREGYNRAMGHEPGTHRFPRGVDEYGAKSWRSKWPNIDIRHENNLTPSRWRKDQFRSERSCRDWQESDRVPGWPAPILGRFNEFIEEVRSRGHN